MKSMRVRFIRRSATIGFVAAAVLMTTGCL